MGQTQDGEAVPPTGDWLTIKGARENNLRSVNVSIPLGTLCAVTGPSGSGKSSLIDDILYPALARRLHRANLKPGRHDAIEGMERIDKVIRVDQSPLGNSPTSNPATYSGVFDLIRQLFAQLPESKQRGYAAKQFSFNVPGGRCERCTGSGQRCIEMHFLPDVWVTCEDCHGRRYKPETLEVRLHGYSISDVLDLSIQECIHLFDAHPKIVRILQTLADVGLEYVNLGQAAPTLSGGEAQRVKLAAELARPDTGRTLYLLDEPTTGLHFDDVRKLLLVLHRLVDMGNTVVVVEHNLDVIKQVDWILDMGPEAGLGGGLLVTAGTPEQVAEFATSSKTGKSSAGKRKRTPATSNANRLRSYTGEYLAPVLAAGPVEDRAVYDPKQAGKEKLAAVHQALVDDDARDAARASPDIPATRPWQAIGKRWHMSDKFMDGANRRWPPEIAGEVIDILADHVGEENLDYTSPKCVVSPVFDDRKVEIYTKNPHELLIKLYYYRLDGIDPVVAEHVRSLNPKPPHTGRCSIGFSNIDDGDREYLRDLFSGFLRKDAARVEQEESA